MNLLINIFLFMNLYQVIANSDSQCCRKQIQCFECDSRYDPRCGDIFNLTKDTGQIVACHDYCVKLKHSHEGTVYYVRTCADTLKKIYIKKTEVCYSARAKIGGHLCFCEQDLCNNSQSFKTNFSFNFSIFVVVLAIYLIMI